MIVGKFFGDSIINHPLHIVFLVVGSIAAFSIVLILAYLGTSRIQKKHINNFLEAIEIILKKPIWNCLKRLEEISNTQRYNEKLIDFKIIYNDLLSQLAHFIQDYTKIFKEQDFILISKLKKQTQNVNELYSRFDSLFNEIELYLAQEKYQLEISMLYKSIFSRIKFSLNQIEYTGNFNLSKINKIEEEISNQFFEFDLCLSKGNYDKSETILQNINQKLIKYFIITDNIPLIDSIINEWIPREFESLLLSNIPKIKDHLDLVKKEILNVSKLVESQNMDGAIIGINQILKKIKNIKSTIESQTIRIGELKSLFKTLMRLILSFEKLLKNLNEKYIETDHIFNFPPKIKIDLQNLSELFKKFFLEMKELSDNVIYQASNIELHKNFAQIEKRFNNGIQLFSKLKNQAVFCLGLLNHHIHLDINVIKKNIYQGQLVLYHCNKLLEHEKYRNFLQQHQLQTSDYNFSLKKLKEKLKNNLTIISVDQSSDLLFKILILFQEIKASAALYWLAHQAVVYIQGFLVSKQNKHNNKLSQEIHDIEKLYQSGKLLSTLQKSLLLIEKHQSNL